MDELDLEVNCDAELALAARQFVEAERALASAKAAMASAHYRLHNALTQSDRDDAILPLFVDGWVIDELGESPGFVARRATIVPSGRG